ncbi:hypothetical protein HCH_06115 [Hahella chejuensis KCTC 2396]|uniref:Uncharacterized protein n=1 Tax=Hahella chejuensis (strain KCTC 2396) TaxID=349521 RepID=Q2S9B1_HAHCH|nr:hypothetical protein HCH_06115 [Hahella chejuensis KCTC 2396]
MLEEELLLLIFLWLQQQEGLLKGSELRLELLQEYSAVN